MRLRRQLILVSLLTLCLPWAGCQYIREMEDALRQGQSVALLASAKAVAAHIANDAGLKTALHGAGVSTAGARPIYLHPLPSAAIVDGYDDDWRHLPLTPTSFTWTPTTTATSGLTGTPTISPNETPAKVNGTVIATPMTGVNAGVNGTPIATPMTTGTMQKPSAAVEATERFSVRFWAGLFDGQIYMFFQVYDSHLSYHNPGLARLASGDHLLLHLGRGMAGRDYVLRTSAPGQLTARYLNSSGHVRQEHRIRGAWRERIGGYQMELRLPLTLSDAHLGFTVVNQDTQDSPSEDSPEPTVQRLGNLGATRQPPALIRRSSSLTSTLGIFAADGLRLSVAARDGWLVAQAGHLQQQINPYEAVSTAPAQHGLLSWLYRLALGEKNLPDLDRPARGGRFATGEVASALAGQRRALWYQDGPRRVGRAAVPIAGGDSTLGAVVAEQSTDEMLALTNSAFNRLFLYSLLATGVAGLGLLAYASWLSFRIRRLSRAADNAIGEDGKIQGTFPTSAAADEVGDLTRSYGQLLGRLQEYTDYLRSLSSKLSHELRTPLAVVRTSLDNLEHEPLPASAEIFAERAREGAGRLSAILTAMSAASRVEQSIKTSERETVMLNLLLQDVVSAYADVYPAQRIVGPADSDDNYSIEGSPELIVQMLDKLVDNAADFCPPQGAITLTLTRNSKQICLAVANDGPPLPAQMQGQLFDSLVSVREPESAAGNGQHRAHLGLGLHIVRLIVEFHRGHVRAYNREDGPGVVFEIRFPAAAGLLTSNPKPA